MITHAVNQKVIDFKIECNGELFGSFLDRDNFLESCIVSNGTEEPQAAPRRRPRIIDNNSRLTQASTPEDSTNEDVLQSEEQKGKMNDKTNEKHPPELAQHLLITTPVPKPRTRLIDDNSWPTLASTSDIAINDNVPHSEEEITENSRETDQDHVAKDENLMQTATDSEASFEPNSVQITLNQHGEEEKPPVPRPRTRIIDDNSSSVLASTSDTNNNDNVLYLEERSTENPKITDRDHEEMGSGENGVEQELTISITDVTGKMLDFGGKQEELAEKSSKVDGINHHQLENRVQEQLKVQEEQMKLREDKLKMREDELDRRVDKIKSMEEQLDKKVDEIRLREEHLERKMEEMIEMMKLVATRLL
ncbi:hypothetical protein CAEBREN_24043 [Caenorhabditis brenneri]|uniref:Uncharacterized protein n=1 Tax=Caenorhabditis brenneri TaxID=135651 RepID=G0MA62_CAEBE|nr:hypothetical protein CAEBREN_24043 [Caenorhabditis brenneri]